MEIHNIYENNIKKKQSYKDSHYVKFQEGTSLVPEMIIRC